MSNRNRRKNKNRRKKKNNKKPSVKPQNSKKKSLVKISPKKQGYLPTNKYGYLFTKYKDETEIPPIKKLMDLDLSEPYSIYTYRYFVNTWPDLCIIVRDKIRVIGGIICKIEEERRNRTRIRGYIAMLVVDREYRKKGLGSDLVKRVIQKMIDKFGVEEVVLETEVINRGALRLYENLGFLRVKRLCKYYLNGGDAFRLKLHIKQKKEKI